MNKKYDFMVYVGRFQPCHAAHIQTIRKALELSERLVIVIGSAFQARDFKNPWTWKERSRMIASELTEAERWRIDFCGVGDETSDDRWARTVQDAVASIIRSHNSNAPQVGIIGLVKDASSFYLSMFPQWAFEEMPNINSLNATDIRSQMFEKRTVLTEALNSPNTASFLEDFMETPEFENLVKEYVKTKDYKDSWAVAPYEPTFVTADSVVIQSGHLLVIERKAIPGRGLLALPGGFIKPHERVFDASIRELREETKLKVPEPVLKGSAKFDKMFDKPDRSLRGRTITVAYLYELAPGPLPKVKGSDDAKRAFWMPLSEVDQNRDKFFEDHYLIIQDMLGKL